MQCSMAWALHRTEKEKPAAGKTDYWRDFWRSGWDSNPRNLAVQLISSQSRYDHFDTAPYLSQHQHLGKRGELMGRTSKNIKLRIPEKPRKIKGFRSGSYRVATTISSASPSTTRTTLRIYFHPCFLPKICSKIRWGENRRESKKYSILRFFVLRCINGNQGDENHRSCRNFECSSLQPLRYASVYKYSLLGTNHMISSVAPSTSRTTLRISQV